MELVIVMVMLSLIPPLLVALVLVLVCKVGRGDELGDGVCGGGGAVLLLDVSRCVVCVVEWVEECTGTIPNKLVVVVGLVISKWNS